MKTINCHLEVRNDTSGYQRLWVIPEVPHISTRNMECIDDTSVRLAKRICSMIENAIGTAIADFRVYGTLENVNKLFGEISVLVRNTECIYGSDYDVFMSEFVHDLIGLRDDDLNSLYEVWYNED